MEIHSNGEIIISKTLFNKIRDFSCETFEDFKKRDNARYVVSKNDLDNFISELEKKLNELFKTKVRSTGNVSLDKFNKLINDYEESLYKMIRDKFNHEKLNPDEIEKLIVCGIDAYIEGKNIIDVPKKISKIKSLISIIRNAKNFKDIDNIEQHFKAIRNNKTAYEAYDTLQRKLTRIISKSYNDNLTKFEDIYSLGSFAFIATEDEENFFLLNNRNISMCNYGLIMDAKDNIKSASNNIDDDVILPFSELNRIENYIKLYDFKPAFVYAITLGEKTLSSNYEKAKILSVKYHNLPIIEIDITKYISMADALELMPVLIDKLCDDKCITFKNKGDNFYKKFNPFFSMFQSVKSKRYEESNIRNLFDHYIKLLFSPFTSEKNDISNLFNYSQKDIEIVLKNNIFFEDNIFRYDEVTKPLLERFVDKFYPYRNNEKLNKIYPGFSVVLDYLNSLSNDDLENCVQTINRVGKVDSWLLSQMISPMHSKNFETTEIQNNSFKTYEESITSISSEKEKIMEFKRYLSSIDDDKTNENTAIRS